MTEILGVILAGGQARRMGGGDKGLLDLGGQSLLAEVISRLRPQVQGLVLNANGDGARFAPFALDVVADSIPDFAGPLAGVLAGMDYAAAHGFSHVLSAAADTPFLPVDLGPRLKMVCNPSQPIALAATREAGRLIRQPTFGLWPVDLREDLRGALQAGVSKVVIWAERHGYGLAEFATDPVDPFFNVNTPEELATARQIWQELADKM